MANLNKVESFMYQSTYLRAQNLHQLRSLISNPDTYFNFVLKFEVILTDPDLYVLGMYFDTVVVYICHDIFNFIQIGFGQAVVAGSSQCHWE